MSATGNIDARSGWKRVRVKDVADAIQYGYTASGITCKEGPRFLRITDIQDGRVDWNTVPSCELSKDDLDKYRLLPGDLVFARTGATTGKSFLIGESPESVFASYLIRVRPSADVNPRYLAAFFQTPEYWRQIESGKRGIGQPNVNGKILGEIELPLAPMEEQHEIVAEIEKQFTRLEAGVAGLRRVQANLKRYRAAVLKAACEGKLVPTEASLRRAEHGRQAELARQEGRALPAPRPGVFFVYAIRCDNDSIYIGHTQDLQKRWREHLAGQGADWATQHKPVLIVHYEECASREEAVAREKWLKTGFGRKWIKREIAAGRLPAHEAGARQAGYETGAQLLERIITERRQKWNGKGKYKEPAKPDFANLPPLPEGWTWASLDELLLNVTDGDHQPPPQTDSGVPFLVIGNIRKHELDFTETRFVSHTYYDAVDSSRKPKRGDILYSLVGSYGIAVSVKTDQHFCVQRHIGILRPHDLSPTHYLVHALNSSFALNQATAVATGTAQKTVPLAGLRRLAIPLPSMQEQTSIVAEVERRLSVVEELEAVVNANLQRAARLRQSILQRAFECGLSMDESERY